MKMEQWNNTIDNEQLSAYIIQNDSIWQVEIMDEGDFVSFCGKRGIVITSDELHFLWQMALVIPDAIVSTVKLHRNDIIFRKMEDNRYYYTAKSMVPTNQRKKALMKKKAILGKYKNIELYYHPFKMFVVSHYKRSLIFNTNPSYFIFVPNGLNNMLVRHREAVHTWMLSDETGDFFRKMNDLANLAIVVEPYIYEQVFNSFTLRNGMTERNYRISIKELKENLIIPMYFSIPQDKMLQILRDITFPSIVVEENVMIHSLIRIISPKLMLQVKGDLGCALIFQIMAEFIRRTYEEIHKVQLVEEDVIPTRLNDDYKERLYGTKRLFDQRSHSAHEKFLRNLGYGSGLHLRWYVEGETEYGAFSSVMQDFGFKGIEIVNLKGKFVEKGGRNILSLKDSLDSNRDRNLLSFISLDADNTENIRAIRNTIMRNEFYGCIFISDPDIEFGNFTRNDLGECIIQMATQQISDIDFAQDKIMKELATAESGKDIEHIVKQLSGFENFKVKSKEWGENLMVYAWNKYQGEHPLCSPCRIAFHTNKDTFHHEGYNIYINGILIEQASVMNEIDMLLRKFQK